MSGIAGIIHFDRRPVEPGQVEAMTAAMHYRGPDGINHWRKANVALGQCMLRTTPESLEETQPLTNEDESLVLVMDGRVDNWEELRRELLGKGAVLRTRADAELVLRAYEIWGRDCLNHIDGDFALVIWDARRQEAFCARDRFGHKPLYYQHLGQGFIFASDLHACLASGSVTPRVNEGMLAEHLCVYIRSLDETLFEGVKRLPPACNLVVGSNRFEMSTYWRIDYRNELRYKTDTEYAEHFFDLFGETVRRQTRSISTVGSYLSGGLDSSSVFLTAARPLGSLAKIDSYTLSFYGVPESDESEYFFHAQRKSGIAGSIIPFAMTPIKYYVDRTKNFKDVGESPNGAMLNQIRSSAYQSGVRVLLTGYGGDEWFGGNRIYWAQLLRSMNFMELSRQVMLTRKRGASVPHIWNAFLYHAISPLMPEPIHRPIRSVRRWFSRTGSPTTNRPSELVHPDFASRVSLDMRLRASEDSSPGVGWHNQHLRNILHSGLAVKSREVDSIDASIFHIEERHPFYDRRVVEFAHSLPEGQRSRSEGKHILREAMRNVLPEPIRTRCDKGDFSQVITSALLDPSISGWLTSRRLSDAGYVDAAHLRNQYQLFKDLHAQGDHAYMDLSWKLWSAFSLEVWLSVLDSKKVT